MGRKIGFTNKTIWPVFGLDTVIWATMYNKTVHYAQGNHATLSLAGTASTRIEPEIVFKLKIPLPQESNAEAAILGAVEWYALGFEMVDCNYPDWKFNPADAIADFGLHFALVVGEPRPIDDPTELAARLRRFQVNLYRNGASVATGAGENVLDSPALALAWLSNTLSEQSGAEPLAAGEIITTGTITEALPVAAGEEWRAEVDGLDLPPLSLKFK